MKCIPSAIILYSLCVRLADSSNSVSVSWVFTPMFETCFRDLTVFSCQLQHSCFTCFYAWLMIKCSLT